jgi:hypothetical protein
MQQVLLRSQQLIGHFLMYTAYMRSYCDSGMGGILTFWWIYTFSVTPLMKEWFFGMPCVSSWCLSIWACALLAPNWLCRFHPCSVSEILSTLGQFPDESEHSSSNNWRSSVETQNTKWRFSKKLLKWFSLNFSSSQNKTALQAQTRTLTFLKSHSTGQMDFAAVWY